MNVRKLLDEAFQKGEKMKEELMVDLVHSRLFTELVKNDRFINAITTVVNAKEEFGKILSTRVKHLLAFMDIPTKQDLDAMTYKVTRLEHQLDRALHEARLSASKKSLHHSTSAAFKTKRGKASKA